MKPRQWAWAATLVLIALSGGFALRLWFHPWAPRLVRMLPEGETLVYLNLEPLRAAGLPLGGWGQPTAIERAPAYASFVRESGFDFERDLDAVAISLRGSPLRPDDSTCVLEGRFGPRFAAYLQAHALRQLRLGSNLGYQFPGWARPQQALTVVPLDRRHVLVTNVGDPATVLTQARAWWPPTPTLWQARLWAPSPIGFLAVDALRLAAARQLDGSAPPWRGAQALRLRLDAGLDGVTLTGEEQTLRPDDAIQSRDWAEAELAALRPLQPSSSNGSPTLATLLNGIVLRQNGDRAEFNLTLSAATLRRLRTDSSASQAPIQ